MLRNIVFCVILWAVVLDSFAQNDRFAQHGILPIFEFQLGFPVGNARYLDQSYPNDVRGMASRFTLAYQINPQTTLGISLGWQDYVDGPSIITALDARYAILKKKMSPVMLFNTGLRWEDVRHIYPYVTPGLGLRLYMPKKQALLLSCGYKWDYESWVYSDPYAGPNFSFWRQYVTIELGLSF